MAMALTKSTHDPEICVGAKPSDGNVWFGSDGRVFWPGRSSAHCGHWQINLRCPACGREGRFVENYLGGKPVLCDGQKFIRPKKQTLAQLVDAMKRQEAR